MTRPRRRASRAVAGWVAVAAFAQLAVLTAEALGAALLIAIIPAFLWLFFGGT